MFIALVVIFTNCFTLIAQDAALQQNRGVSLTFTGKVLSADNKAPLPQATVSLLKSADSSIVSHAICNTHGNYSINNIDAGSYLLVATFLGYEKQYISKPLTNPSATTIADTFVLTKKFEQLTEVKVTARRPPIIEFKNGQITMNVENLLSASGGTAFNLLESAPNVSITGDGSIKLNGKPSVLIMIDGKPNYLSSQEVINMLKAMSANDISKIEIIPNPSAKYEASGNAGIINIITKKSRKKGFNASMNGSYAQGFYPKFNGGMEFNYSKNKTNLFGNFSHTENKNKYYSYSSRKLTSGALADIIDLNEDKTSRMGFDNFRLGVDHSINKNNTLSAGIRGRRYGTKDMNLNLTNVFTNSSLASYLQTRSRLNDKYWNVSEYVSFESNLDSAGKKISFDADYTTFNNPQIQNYTTDYFGKDGSIMQNASQVRNNISSKINIISLKTDYEMPLSGNIKLEAGAKFNVIKTDNDIVVDTLRTNNWINDLSRSNRFKYREAIGALYLTLTKQFKSLTVQAGLRAENTHLNGNQVTADTVFTRNFFNLFPNLFIQKQLDSNNVLTFSFGRRIDRPNYEMLNPFTYYSDPYTITKGNPLLLPQYTLTYNVTHSYKDLLISSLSYSKISQMFSQVSNQSHLSNVTEFNYVNLDAMKVVNLSVSSPLKVTKFWQTVLNAATSYTEITSRNLFGGSLSRSITDYSFNSTNTFTLGKNTKAELSGYYNSPGIYAFYRINSIYNVSLAFQQTLLQKKATLRLAFSDIFWSQIEAGHGNFLNQDIIIRNKRDTRQVRLSFIYKFGSAVVSRKRTAASEEETQRLKQ